MRYETSTLAYATQDDWRKRLTCVQLQMVAMMLPKNTPLQVNYQLYRMTKEQRYTWKRGHNKKKNESKSAKTTSELDLSFPEQTPNASLG